MCMSVSLSLSLSIHIYISHSLLVQAPAWRWSPPGFYLACKKVRPRYHIKHRGLVCVLNLCMWEISEGEFGYLSISKGLVSWTCIPHSGHSLLSSKCWTIQLLQTRGEGNKKKRKNRRGTRASENQGKVL